MQRLQSHLVGRRNLSHTERNVKLNVKYWRKRTVYLVYVIINDVIKYFVGKMVLV